MRKCNKISLLILLSLVTFGVGAVTAIVDHWGQPLVCLRVENASGKELRSLSVRYNSSGFKGQVETIPPKPGTSATVCFYHQGEGGCQITVTLADGKVLQGVGGYIEPGYSLVFKITDRSITGGLGGPQ